VLLRYQDKSLLVSFAEAWLCDPNCPPALLAWDTTDDDYIDYHDYVDNTSYFEGAFSSNIYYCLTDKNNSVVGVVDADGDIEYIAYNAWGTPNYTGNIQGLSVLWNGYYFDAETENYYLRNRYYSPDERRFLTDDPHGIVPDGNWNNPWNITNQYADGVGLTVYAGFNPITGRDDWGLKGCAYVACGKLKETSIWRKIGNGLGFRHCETRNDKSASDREDEVFYDTEIDNSSSRTLLAGKNSGKKCSCATCPEVQECLLRAYHEWNTQTEYRVIGNNCHRGVALALSKCCLKTKWKPSWHGGPPQECLNWETYYYFDPISNTMVSGERCTQWTPSIN
jgi:RHS repeat-associated protein